jgi:hypothetical protein
MRFTSLFSALAVVVIANAANKTSPIDTITQALKQGDFVGAAIDILTLGRCDIANDAGKYFYCPRAITRQDPFISNRY